jgi:DNA invertase Pin-like site-specific DNA recombinase
MTIHIMSAVAQEEARAISARTEVALAAAQARGQLLGAHPPGASVDDVGSASEGPGIGRAEHFREGPCRRRGLAPEIATMRAEGMSFGAIANRLNAEGQTTRTGTAWHPAQV